MCVKSSELIAFLQRVIAKHGDVEVVCEDAGSLSWRSPLIESEDLHADDEGTNVIVI